jgi:hypothetical protein
MRTHLRWPGNRHSGLCGAQSLQQVGIKDKALVDCKICLKKLRAVAGAGIHPHDLLLEKY